MTELYSYLKSLQPCAPPSRDKQFVVRHSHIFVIIITFLAFSFANPAASEEPLSIANLNLSCTFHASTLKIQLAYPEGAQGKKVPCEISYQRNASPPHIIWQTDKDIGFCEAKLKMLVDKLLREDWACKETFVSEKEEKADEKISVKNSNENQN